jgi:hypothetical protein
VQRSGRCRVGELLNRGGDPAPGVRTIMIAVGRELKPIFRTLIDPKAKN